MAPAARSPDGTLTAVFNRILSGLGRTLIAAGVILLLFVGYQLWGTSLEQAGHQKDLTQQLESQVAPEGSSLDDVTASLAEVDPATAPPTEPAAEGEPLGVIEIPRIAVQQVFIEGVSKADLKKGPGHYPSTPLPGQAGNAALAGHRTTYGAPFNRIDELQPGDPINVYTPQGKFRYEVVAPPPGVGIEQGPGWYSVAPEQTEVLGPTDDNRLTLTACHPKRSAKQRIVVQAILANEPAPTSPAPEPQPGTETAAGPSSDADLFGGDPSAKWPALAFGLGFLAVWLLAWFVGHKWWKKPWLAYVVLSPVMAVLLWFCFYHADHWLPSF